MPNLHACPYCGSPVQVIDLGGGHVCIGCEECGMGGPVARNRDVELARRGWEILCARMCSHCRTNLIRHFTQRIKELKQMLADKAGASSAPVASSLQPSASEGPKAEKSEVNQCPKSRTA